MYGTFSVGQVLFEHVTCTMNAWMKQLTWRNLFSTCVWHGVTFSQHNHCFLHVCFYIFWPFQLQRVVQGMQRQQSSLCALWQLHRPQHTSGYCGQAEWARAGWRVSIASTVHGSCPKGHELIREDLRRLCIQWVFFCFFFLLWKAVRLFIIMLF